jgi:phosphate transport system substrate-binding protein
MSAVLVYRDSCCLFSFVIALVLSPQLTGCTLVYNLPGLTNVLRLDANVLALIGGGHITFWNDTALVALNPQLSGSGFQQPIQFVVRGASSTTTYQLTDYLVRQGGGAWTQGRTQTPTWPSSTTIKDDGNVLAAFVSSTPFTLGYAKYRTASRSSASIATVKNQAGQFVLPNAGSIAAAGAGNVLPANPADNFSQVFAGHSSAPLAYPLANFMYIIVYSQYSANSPALKPFLEYINTDAAQTVAPLYFVSVPSAVRTRNAAVVATLTVRPAAGTSTGGGVLGAASQTSMSPVLLLALVAWVTVAIFAQVC